MVSRVQPFFTHCMILREVIIEQGNNHGMCHMSVDNNKMYADYVYNLIKDNYNL